MSVHIFCSGNAEFSFPVLRAWEKRAETYYCWVWVGFSLTDKRATLRCPWICSKVQILDTLYGVVGKFGINGMVSLTLVLFCGKIATRLLLRRCVLGRQAEDVQQMLVRRLKS